MLKPTVQNLKKLENLFSDLGYQLRFEKGHFQSGWCLVELKKMVVVNKFFDATGRWTCLLDILSNIPVDYERLSEPSKKLYREIFPPEGKQLKIEE